MTSPRFEGHKPGYQGLHQLIAPLSWVQDVLLNMLGESQGLQQAAKFRQLLHHRVDGM
jgi:hypothetical protein